MVEITEELIERINPDPSCDYCEHGRVKERTRELGPTNEDVTVEICTSCHTTADTGHFLPPRRADDSEDGSLPSVDHDRARYRGSGNVIMNGAHPAYEDGDEYGLDDGTASYEQFVTA